MWDAFIGGLLINLQFKSFLYMLIGSAIGFWVGILPGIGGGTTLALMLPFHLQDDTSGGFSLSPGDAFRRSDDRGYHLRSLRHSR